MPRDVQLPDFDTMMTLHRDNPEAFEQFRKELLRQAVAEAPEGFRPALEQLLERIETARAEASTPMEAVLIANQMMSDSIMELRGAWETAHYELAGLQAAILIERLSAASLPGVRSVR